MRIAIALVIIGIVVGIVFYGQMESDRKVRMEAAAFAEQVSYAESQYASIIESLDGVEDLGPAVWSVMSAASNIVPEIVGSANALRVYDKDYDKKQKRTAAAAKAAARGPAKKGGAPAGKGDIKVGVKDASGREAPAGFSSRADAAKRAKLEEEKKANASAKDPVAAKQDDEDDKATQRIPKCQRIIEKIAEHCAMVDARIDESAQILVQNENLLGAVKKSASAYNAGKVVVGYKELVPMAKDLKKSIEDEIATAKALLPALETMKAEVIEEKRLATEKEAKRRRAEERKAKRALEISMANAWYEGKANMLREYDFDGAMQAVKGLQASLTYEDASTVLNMPIERYKLMDGIMTWLVGVISKSPMKWGWKTASGARDIEKADADGIYVQEKLIAWTDLPKAKLVGFIEHYIKNDDTTGKGKARLYIGVALYCKTFGVEDKEDHFLEKASDNSELLAKSISGLMNFTPDATLNRE